MMASLSLPDLKTEDVPFLTIEYPLNVALLEPNSSPYERMVVHHAGSRDYSVEDLIDLHMRKLGMGAIGYHFLIDSEGQILYSRDLRFKGAHAYPNTGKIGIGFLRSFSITEPNERETNALRTLTEILTKGNGSRMPVVGHNQNQVLELLSEYESIAHYPELLQRILLPNSAEDFERAKTELHRVGENIEVNGAVELHQFITKLKTCPGIGAYKGMMQYVQS